jgi:hypothetical protein
MEWISVTDRMPQPEQEVVWYMFDGIRVKYRFASRVNFGTWRGKLISHWLPLPPPPARELSETAQPTTPAGVPETQIDKE